MKTLHISPIGTIHTPFKTIHNIPIQPFAAKGVKGFIELFPEYTEGLTDLDGFSHITLLYHFHETHTYELRVKPFMDHNEHGIFATRAPKRPNAIGISTVKLIGIEKHIVYIEEVDILDGTPLIDIKPFFRKFDNRIKAKSGWLDLIDKSQFQNIKSDKRFKK
jgi:tRNA-Thr(GGU) m(6)t(6)A37 methyltransferase TsaA